MKLQLKSALILASAGCIFLASGVQAAATPELYQIFNLTHTSNNYQGQVGDQLKLTGKNFNQTNISVKFGSTSVTPTSKTDGEIKFNVPTVTTDRTYAVSVTNGTNESSSQNFYVQAAGSTTPELYQIFNLTHTSNNYQGQVGDQLKLTGKNFNQTNISVKFGSTSVTPTSKTDGEIKFNIPSVTTDNTYAVSVTNGTASSAAQDFYVQAAVTTPELWQIYSLTTPQYSYQGLPGDVLKLTGRFNSGTSNAVLFGSFVVNPTLVTSSELQFSIPSSVAYDHVYAISVQESGRISAGQDFYIKPNPTTLELWQIYNVTHPSYNYQGKVGDQLRLTGRNFNQAGIAVKFGSTIITDIILSSTGGEMIINVPNVTKNRTYAISVISNVSSSASQNFYVRFDWMAGAVEVVPEKEEEIVPIQKIQPQIEVPVTEKKTVPTQKIKPQIEVPVKGSPIVPVVGTVLPKQKIQR